ncbi:MAG: hypothetical protein IJI27_08020 [Oscillospiraceae bacterium]|nr:hypothetical protein [Oscillospiraceae bacterium]
MPAEYTNDGVNLSKVMLDHLNSWPVKPAQFILDDFEKDPPSLMLQQLAAAKVVRRYVNGSYIGNWMFSVEMRVSGEDTASRLAATTCLNDLEAWLTQKDRNGNFSNFPTIDSSRAVTGIEMTTAPAISARYDGGVSDYQAVFTLEFKFSARR